MLDLTFVVPCSLYHQEIVEQAIESVKNQTITCKYLVIEDTQRKGTGWARNQGLEKVDTAAISFLDADDTLDPRFAEICLSTLEHYQAQGQTDPRYVYTDWINADLSIGHAPTPCEAWTNKTYHLVTTVIPTQYARLIGGFDEAMQGVEDVDFYVRLRLAGLCGLRVNSPLVHYRDGGQRSQAARQSGEETAVQSYISQRYGGYSLMACCGDNTPTSTGPTNEPLEGDVLAQAQWRGNRQERGRATGRLYPRTAYPKLLYVAEADVVAAPMHWQRVTTPMQTATGIVLQPAYTPVANWSQVANELFGGGVSTPVQSPVEYHPNITGKKKSDVLKQVKTEGDEK